MTRETVMYTIMIVDDEPKHRRCLADMIRILRPRYEVLEAKNGKEAQELAESEDIDIIITDIRMPIMDGLSLTEAVNRKSDSTKVIILSGFAYFDYAQKALSLGAFDFVLKPVNEAKISGILEKVEKAIEKECTEKQEKKRLEEQLNAALPAYVDQKLNEWVKGYANAGGLEEIEKVFPFKGDGFVIATEVSGLNNILTDYSRDEIYEIKLNIKQWMKEILNPLGHTISFFLEGNRNIMITIVNSDSLCSMASKENPYMLDDFIKNIQASYGLDTYIGVGSEYADIFNHVRTSLDESLQALNYKFYENNDTHLFLFSSYKISLYSDYSKEYVMINKVKEALFDGNTQEVKNHLAELFEGTNKKMPPQQFKYLVEDTILGAVKQLLASINEDKKTELLSDARKSLLAAESLSELRHVVEEIVSAVKALKPSKNDKIIKACEKYVKEHYMEDISLDSVAEIFCFNVSYFSSYFKNNSGMNFSEYLQKVRMEKAVELLHGHDFKIYEVAEKVGYRNVKYFNKVFKKERGVTPDEYRRTDHPIRCCAII